MSETTNQPNEDVAVTRKPVAIAGEVETAQEVPSGPPPDEDVTRKPVPFAGDIDGQAGTRSPKNDRDREIAIADTSTAAPKAARKPVVIGDEVKPGKDDDRGPKNTGS
jgi:hypothetical protein